MTPRLRWIALTQVAGFLVSGCSYHNAMWSAKRHASDARQLEQHGQTSDARAQWAQAAAKAKAWRTDDALVLQSEGLAYSGACRDADASITRARAGSQDATRRERIDLADAACALAGGDPVRAEAALAGPLGSKNADRRSRAEYLAGRAAALRLDYDAASGHFRRSSMPSAAGQALVSEQQLRIARATQRSDLAHIATELMRLLRTVSGTEDAGRVLELLTSITGVSETPAARFRVAELARDSLHAPALAGQLFLEAVAADPMSVYAPKALIAALAVLPERRDSIAALLDARYATSPYTRVFHGALSVAYTAAEDSLARELGVQALGPRSADVSGDGRFDAPVPGPRGPRFKQ
jgi:uncharacterized protein YfiM (DUF2279 family)